MFVSILHADADAFFASVEQRDDPALRGRALIVGEGVVMAASYEARACGVHGGMHGARARRLCPEAVFVPARFAAYVEASRELFAVFDRTAPVVEGLSLEEAFLDVRGLERISGSPRAIAIQLRRDVCDEVGLAVTVGVARTRLLAKMASRAAKPDGLLELAPADETPFLHPLAVEALWGVGEKTARKLHARGIRTVADAAARSETELMGILGRAAGGTLFAAAHHREVRAVRPPPRRRSFGGQHALGRGPHAPAALDAVLLALADRITRRMRAEERAGRTVTLHVRFDDFTRVSRARTLPAPTHAHADVVAAARELFGAVAPLVARRGCTLLGLSLGNLAEAPAQLALPLGGGEDVDRRRDGRGARPLRRRQAHARGAPRVRAPAGAAERPGRTLKNQARRWCDCGPSVVDRVSTSLATGTCPVNPSCRPQYRSNAGEAAARSTSRSPSSSRPRSARARWNRETASRASRRSCATTT